MNGLEHVSGDPPQVVEASCWHCRIRSVREIKHDTDSYDEGSPELLMMNRACLLERRIFGRKLAARRKELLHSFCLSEGQNEWKESTLDG